MGPRVKIAQVILVNKNMELKKMLGMQFVVLLSGGSA